ncbi:MAG: gluconate 2-dehydrogenase subunit 3 family protein [Acidobacteria bacterium]|nr:gluconate 2-dehydrogenase subunit 3 family protein [Acidobacteriota bacterium]
MSTPEAAFIIREMDIPVSEAARAETKSELERFLLNRRALIRAALCAGATALMPGISLAQAIEAELTPAARGEDGSKALSAPDWKPAFLNDHENETLIALADVIIPATDTPGAKDALVNRFLDLLFSIEPAESQRQFRDALESIDKESRKQLDKDFRELAVEDQIWLVRPWAYPAESDRSRDEEGRSSSAEEQFLRLKGMIAFAYYGSEIGQKELGWDGEFTHGPFEGCDHEDRTHT